MNQYCQTVLLKILNMPEVDDTILVTKQGDYLCNDGRYLLPVYIYLRPQEAEGGTLGVTVTDGIEVNDIPMPG